MLLTMEPVVNLCASGALDRVPGLRFATIEANAGWLPRLLDTMDEGVRKHHMYVNPKLKMLPSEYFRRRILGLNAARVFRFDIPEQYRKA